MKNILVVALASIVLFGVAAGLTVWLQMNGTKTADSGHGDDKKKKSTDDHGEKKDGDKGHADDSHKPETKPTAAKDASREADLAEYRRLQVTVAAADLSGQMQDYDKLLKRVSVEMKVLAAEQQQIDEKLAEVKQVEASTAKSAADIKKKQADAEAAEEDNLLRIAGLFDLMQPEEAAAQVQAWADSGQTDTAVKVLLKMKQAKATKVMSAVADKSAKEAIYARMKSIPAKSSGP